MGHMILRTRTLLGVWPRELLFPLKKQLLKSKHLVSQRLPFLQQKSCLLQATPPLVEESGGLRQSLPLGRFVPKGQRPLRESPKGSKAQREKTASSVYITFGHPNRESKSPKKENFVYQYLLSVLLRTASLESSIKEVSLRLFPSLLGRRQQFSRAQSQRNSPSQKERASLLPPSAIAEGAKAPRDSGLTANLSESLGEASDSQKWPTGKLINAAVLYWQSRIHSNNYSWPSYVAGSFYPFPERHTLSDFAPLQGSRGSRFVPKGKASSSVPFSCRLPFGDSTEKEGIFSQNQSFLCFWLFPFVGFMFTLGKNDVLGDKFAAHAGFKQLNPQLINCGEFILPVSVQQPSEGEKGAAGDSPEGRSAETLTGHSSKSSQRERKVVATGDPQRFSSEAQPQRTQPHPLGCERLAGGASLSQPPLALPQRGGGGCERLAAPSEGCESLADAAGDKLDGTYTFRAEDQAAYLTHATENSTEGYFLLNKVQPSSTQRVYATAFARDLSLSQPVPTGLLFRRDFAKGVASSQRAAGDSLTSLSRPKGEHLSYPKGGESLAPEMPTFCFKLLVTCPSVNSLTSVSLSSPPFRGNVALLGLRMSGAATLTSRAKSAGDQREMPMFSIDSFLKASQLLDNYYKHNDTKVSSRKNIFPFGHSFPEGVTSSRRESPPLRLLAKGQWPLRGKSLLPFGGTASLSQPVSGIVSLPKGGHLTPRDSPLAQDKLRQSNERVQQKEQLDSRKENASRRSAASLYTRRANSLWGFDSANGVQSPLKARAALTLRVNARKVSAENHSTYAEQQSNKVVQFLKRKVLFDKLQAPTANRNCISSLTQRVRGVSLSTHSLFLFAMPEKQVLLDNFTQLSPPPISWSKEKESPREGAPLRLLPKGQWPLQGRVSVIEGCSGYTKLSKESLYKLLFASLNSVKDTLPLRSIINSDKAQDTLSSLQEVAFSFEQSSTSANSNLLSLRGHLLPSGRPVVSHANYGKLKLGHPLLMSVRQSLWKGSPSPSLREGSKVYNIYLKNKFYSQFPCSPFGTRLAGLKKTVGESLVASPLGGVASSQRGANLSESLTSLPLGQKLSLRGRSSPSEGISRNSPPFGKSPFESIADPSGLFPFPNEIGPAQYSSSDSLASYPEGVASYPEGEETPFVPAGQSQPFLSYASFLRKITFKIKKNFLLYRMDPYICFGRRLASPEKLVRAYFSIKKGSPFGKKQASPTNKIVLPFGASLPKRIADQSIGGNKANVHQLNKNPFDFHPSEATLPFGASLSQEKGGSLQSYGLRALALKKARLFLINSHAQSEERRALSEKQGISGHTQPEGLAYAAPPCSSDKRGVGAENRSRKRSESLVFTEAAILRAEHVYSPRLLIKNRFFSLRTSNKENFALRENIRLLTSIGYQSRQRLALGFKEVTPEIPLFDGVMDNALPSASLSQPVGVADSLVALPQRLPLEGRTKGLAGEPNGQDSLGALKQQFLFRLEQEPSFPSDSKEQEQRKNNQKKRRRKKLKKETRRRKKRKIFYPKPLWMRYRIYSNLLNKRYKFTQPVSPRDSGSAGDQQVLRVSSAQRIAALPIPKGSGLQFSLPCSLLRAPSVEGGCERIAGVFSLREEVAGIASKNYFTISRSVLEEFKRVLWKSNWLRANLMPYLKSVTHILNEIKESTKRMELLKNVRSFVNLLGRQSSAQPFVSNPPETGHLVFHPSLSGKNCESPSLTPKGRRLPSQRERAATPGEERAGRDALTTLQVRAGKDKPNGSYNSKQHFLPKSCWETSLYVEEYNRITYERLQQFISQIRENSLFLKPLLQQAEASGRLAVEDPHQRTATPFSPSEGCYAGAGRRKANLNGGLAMPLKIRATHFSHAQRQAKKKQEFLLSIQSKSIWVNLGKTIMSVATSLPTLTNVLGEKTRMVSRGGLSTVFLNHQSFHSPSGLAVLQRGLTFDFLSFYKKNVWKEELCLPQLRMYWALSKTSYNFAPFIAQNLTGNKDANNGVKCKAYMKKLWSSPQNKAREQSKYNKTKKMGRNISIKFQLFLNEQYELTQKYGNYEIEHALTPTQRVGLQFSFPQRGEGGASFPKGTESLVSASLAAPGEAAPFGGNAAPFGVTTQPKGRDGGNLMSLLFEKYFYKIAQKQEKIAQFQSFLVHPYKKEFIASFHKQTVPLRPLPNGQGPLRGSDARGPLESYALQGLCTPPALSYAQSFSRFPQRSSPLRGRRSPKGALAPSAMAEGVRYIAPLAIAKEETQTPFFNLTNKSSYWWLDVISSFAPFEFSHMQFLVTNKNNQIILHNKSKQGLFPPAKQPPSLLRRAATLAQGGESPSKARINSNDSIQCFLPQGPLPLWQGPKGTDSSLRVTKQISSLLFHFCCILSLVSISQIRGLLKFYLLIFSKISKATVGILTTLNIFSYASFRSRKSWEIIAGHSSSQETPTYPLPPRDSMILPPAASFLLPEGLRQRFSPLRPLPKEQRPYPEGAAYAGEREMPSLPAHLGGQAGVASSAKRALSLREGSISRDSLTGSLKGRLVVSGSQWKEPRREGFITILRQKAMRRVNNVVKQELPDFNKFDKTSKMSYSRTKWASLAFPPKGAATFPEGMVAFTQKGGAASSTFSKMRAIATRRVRAHGLRLANFLVKNSYILYLQTNGAFKQTFDLLAIVGPRSLFSFFEKPGELIMDWIAFLFLVEWASDATNNIPENVDYFLGNSLFKTTRHMYGVLLQNAIGSTPSLSPVGRDCFQKLPFLGVSLGKAPFGYNTASARDLQPSLLTPSGYSPLPLRPLPKGQGPLRGGDVLFEWGNSTEQQVSQNPASMFSASLNIIEGFLRNVTLLNYGSLFIKRLFFSLYELLLFELYQPDTDLIVRHKKGVIFWDIWGDFLMQVAEDSNINVSELASLKEEQIKLLELLSLQNIPFSVRESKLLFSVVSETRLFPWRLPVSTAATLLPTRWAIAQRVGLLGDFSKGASAPLAIAKGVASPARELQPEGGKSLRKSSPFGVRAVSSQREGPKFQSSFKRKQVSGFPQQYLSYQGKDSDLFIDLHPPKSFSMVSFLKNQESVQYTVGSLVCQIYAGIMSKQISKNILVVGSSGIEKTLLIQAIAGETEIKIITDNAYRYAMVYRGVAVGIKLLRDVFDSLALHTPCLFLIEDIHAIGERRPLLISDDENTKGAEGTGFASHQREEILPPGEKNLIFYELSKHMVTHYRKPYKGDFSMLIPTNLFCFDLWKNNRFVEGSSGSEPRRLAAGNALSSVWAKQGEKPSNDSSVNQGIASGYYPLKNDVLPPNPLSLSSHTKQAISRNSQNTSLLGDSTSSVFFTRDPKSLFKKSGSSKNKSALTLRVRKGLPSGSRVDMLSLDGQYMSPRKIVVEKPWGCEPVSMGNLASDGQGAQTSNMPGLAFPGGTAALPQAADQSEGGAASTASGSLQGGRSNALLSKPFNSIRVKVAILADAAISTLSVKLDMITDLLVIIDSVKANRGFVVFATTHVPFILDPALRRPGRLDETITLGLFPNLLSRWEIFKSSFALFYAGKEQSGFSKGFSLDFLTPGFTASDFRKRSVRIGDMSSLSACAWLTGRATKRVKTIEVDFQRISQRLATPLLNLDVSSERLGTPFGVSWRSAAPFVALTLPQKGCESFSTKGAASPVGKKRIASGNGSLARESLNKWSILSKTKLRSLQKAYFYASTMLNEEFLDITSSNSTNPALTPTGLRTPGKRDLLPMSNSILNEISPLYLSLYASPKLFKRHIITYMSGKLGEMLFFSSSFKSLPAQRISAPKGLAIAGDFSRSLGSKGIGSATLPFGKERLPLIGRFAPSLPFGKKGGDGRAIAPMGSERVTVTPKGRRFPFQLQSKSSFSYGLSNTWHAVSALVLSFIHKRFIYHSHLMLPKFLNFNNTMPLLEVPSPPSSNILLPARRYENYKRSFSYFNQTVSRPFEEGLGIVEKIQIHRQQRLVKQLYSLPGNNLYSRNNNFDASAPQPHPTGRGRGERRGADAALPSPSVSSYSSGKVSMVLTKQEVGEAYTSLMVGSSVSALQKISNTNFFVKNKIFIRHKNYLTNQWSTGQFPEHNAESTYLSDIDWRYTFVESIGDLLLDFPDADQHYNPRNRRWLLTKGAKAYHNWFDFEKTLYSEIYSHFIFDSFLKAYASYEQNREILDFYAFYILKNASVSDFSCVQRSSPDPFSSRGISQTAGDKLTQFAASLRKNSVPKINEFETFKLYKRFFCS